jgi:hypothetical protein
MPTPTAKANCTKQHNSGATGFAHENCGGRSAAQGRIRPKRSPFLRWKLR